MKHLIPYFKKYKLQSILAPLFKMLEACFDLAVPLIVASIIDNGIANSDKSYIIGRFFLLLLMALLGLLSSFTAQFFAAKAAIGTATGLRHQLLSKVQSLSFNELDRIGKSTLITRMTGDINQVQNGVNMFLRLFMRSPFIVFGAAILAFTVDKELALVFVGIILVLFVAVFGMMKITKPLHKKVQKALDAVTGETAESINGVRVIRAFCREEAQKKSFRKVNADLLSRQLKVGRASALLGPVTFVVVNTAIILVLYFGAEKTDRGLLFSGDIVALINYIGQILIELVKLANLITLIARAVASMERVGQLLDTESTMKYGDEASGDETADAVTFNNVSFTYGGAGAPSLSEVSFTVKKGETVGIIGGTGSGKSTLVHLITRFYDATEGEVLLKGKNIKAWQKKALNNTVSLVAQKALLFSGTVRSNLLWGNRDATDEELWQALEMGQAKSFVEEKDGGLDAEIEEGGRNLSGGQRQRLTIARALVSKADVLILDDSASALDFATEAALKKALKSLHGEKTVFIVSQRTSSIAHADKILVLDDGMLVGVGEHESLLTSCEVYREIYESQFEKGVQ
ncbi:MAG: ABC transporter ATP-binding protein [Ruminococcaceae bacterium]|nr:ABC transporter ATP-binding protein [Oscillospiraceae bacterium]